MTGDQGVTSPATELCAIMATVSIEAPALEATPMSLDAAAPVQRLQRLNVDGQAGTSPNSKEKNSELPSSPDNPEPPHSSQAILEMGERLYLESISYQGQHGYFQDWDICEELPLPSTEEEIPPTPKGLCDQGCQVDPIDKWDNHIIQDKQSQIGEPDPTLFDMQCFQSSVAKAAKWPANYYPTPRGHGKTFQIKCPRCEGTWFHSNVGGMLAYQRHSMGRELRRYSHKESCWYCTGARSFDIPCKGRSERHAITVDYKGQYWIYTETQSGSEFPPISWRNLCTTYDNETGRRDLFWEYLNQGLKHEDRYDYLDEKKFFERRVFWGGRYIHLHRDPPPPPPPQVMEEEWEGSEEDSQEELPQLEWVDDGSVD